MKRISFSIIALLLFLSSCQQDRKETKLEIDKGIPLEIAQYRKQHYSDIRYRLMFDIPADKNEKINAKETINLEINEVSRPLIIDFNEDASHLKAIRVNGNEIEIDHRNEHIIIAEDNLKKGANEVEIDFVAGELSLNRNEDFLYTLLVPDRASTVFPCFDQPDLKSTYELSLKVPESWNTLANGNLKEKTQEAGKTVYHFNTSDKMSTYLFSFVAGVFTEVTQNPGHFEMTLLHREDNEERLEASTDEIFKIHERSLSFLEDYTAYKFPFQKLDFATIPGFQYGGMEHVGAIQYRQSSLFLDENATESRKLGRARLIAHETAHMWFGDLVTMKWFNDVWMKEVFANFMADKIVNPTFPDINHKLQFLTAHYPSAYSEDRTEGATPIRQYLDNLKNAGTLYGRIIYNKAPIMMRQLETLIGEDNFRDGIREYISTYANNNADWPELISILDTRTPADLKKWSEVWVNQPGRPKFTYELKTSDGTIESFRVDQQAEDGSDKLWTQLFDIAFVYGDEIRTAKANIEGKSTEIPEVKGWKTPDDIIFNYNGIGYGIFPLQKDNIEAIPAIQDPVARAQSYLNLYENMLDGEVAPIKVMNVLRNSLSSEKEELILSLIVGQLRTIFWTYISSEQRDKLVDDLEAQLRNELYKNTEGNIKRTVFGLYRSLAYNEKGQELLYKLWNENEKIKGLNLSNNDLSQIAASLAIYRHPEAESILDKATDDIKNADRRKRFEFLRPSLSNDTAVRDAFFESLRDAKNREKEAWVLTSLGYLNHPLRAASSEKYINTSLELLEEIQLTGDIFFPKRWLVNTVGAFSSENAYREVRAFLDRHPDYNPVLKAKLLQAADPLFRAQKIKS
ncbi:peptidase M1 [Leptobacterium flavescens]|uniref:Aminopeptidase N n=1 Tax=Leptobacterium flavescens TaxID=472055 RepID=A0A6P0UIP0_9FLAO|nr:M1 family aminopeptidase [Leptobacterium flavescens]NER12857.1 peptidase M1 [Leptobacterium flavescens]